MDNPILIDDPGHDAGVRVPRRRSRERKAADKLASDKIFTRSTLAEAAATGGSSFLQPSRPMVLKVKLRRMDRRCWGLRRGGEKRLHPTTRASIGASVCIDSVSTSRRARKEAACYPSLVTGLRKGEVICGCPRRNTLGTRPRFRGWLLPCRTSGATRGVRVPCSRRDTVRVPLWLRYSE